MHTCGSVLLTLLLLAITLSCNSKQIITRKYASTFVISHFLKITTRLHSCKSVDQQFVFMMIFDVCPELRTPHDVKRVNTGFEYITAWISRSPSPTVAARAREAAPRARRRHGRRRRPRAQDLLEAATPKLPMRLIQRSHLDSHRQAGSGGVSSRAAWAPEAPLPLPLPPPRPPAWPQLLPPPSHETQPPPRRELTTPLSCSAQAPSSLRPATSRRHARRPRQTRRPPWRPLPEGWPSLWQPS